MGVLQKLGGEWEVRPATVNSGPGLIMYTEGQLTSVVAIEIEGGRIQAIYLVSNPDKLRLKLLANLGILPDVTS
jgi:RNA polymerase sigma-70 factor (ECF subfamily)